jgi:hypothetical protein
MKLLRILLSLTLAVLLFTQCEKDEMSEPELKRGPLPDVVPAKMFTVSVENVSTPYKFFEAGAEFGVTGGDAMPPAHPGESISFHFYAGPSHKLSFATMYGLSNDGFYAPDGDGITLYDNTGTPLTGDITSQIMLWDAGTQMNQMPGPGNPHNGADTEDPVQLMSDVGDGYNYGSVETNLKVMLAYNGDHMFTLTIDVLSDATTAISPVAWVVHSMANPIFEAGMTDWGLGLEDLAETGNPVPLTDYLTWNSGYVSPIAPVLWVVHEKGEMPIFTNNTADRGNGLELLAETGNPGDLASSLTGMGYNAGAYAVPDGADDAGPLFPGDKYTFSLDAKPGQYLSIASMLGNSNDIFFAFGDSGIKLAFGNDTQDITDKVMLFDAGTEVNEYPGTKSMDEDEGGVVRPLNDGYTYPSVNKIIKVTIHKNKQ